MVHILEGNSELGTHLWSEKGNLICFIRLFMPTAVSKRVLSYHLIQVPWMKQRQRLKPRKDRPKFKFLINIQNLGFFFTFIRFE